MFQEVAALSALGITAMGHGWTSLGTPDKCSAVIDMWLASRNMTVANEPLINTHGCATRILYVSYSMDIIHRANI